MKLLLSGGVLAQGARSIRTREDWLWERAAWADYFFRTYGWDWWVLERQPGWLTERLPHIGNMLAEIEREQAERA